MAVHFLLVTELQLLLFVKPYTCQIHNYHAGQFRHSSNQPNTVKATRRHLLCVLAWTGDDRGECTILLAGLLQPTLLELSQSKQSNSKAPQQINDASAEAV